MLPSPQISVENLNGATGREDLGLFPDRQLIISLVFLGVIATILLRILPYHFDSERIQTVLFPIVIFLFIIISRRYLPGYVLMMLVLTIPVSFTAVMWNRGAFQTGGAIYLASSSSSRLSDKLERLRIEYNRVAEIQGFPEVIVLQEGISRGGAREFLDKRNAPGILVFDYNNVTYLTWSLGERGKRSGKMEFKGASLEVSLFPDYFAFPLDDPGSAVSYLRELSHAFDGPLDMESLRQSGKGAGAVYGLWRTPVPRAAALFLAASSGLSQIIESGKTEPAEIQCVKKELFAVSEKLKRNDFPEIRAAMLNNLGVLQVLAARSPRELVKAHKFFKSAMSIRDKRGRIVEGAENAVRNLIALDAARLMSLTRVSSPRRQKSRMSYRPSKKVERSRSAIRFRR